MTLNLSTEPPSSLLGGRHGTFRDSLEEVLRSCRSRSGVVLDACHIFIREPLLDWTIEPWPRRSLSQMPKLVKRRREAMEEILDASELKPENSEDSQSSTWGHSPNEDLRWPRCPAFDLSLSDTEQAPDQYKFDPEVVATMVDEGSGLEDLSEHLCEVMANGLEEHAEDNRGIPRKSERTACPTPGSQAVKETDDALDDAHWRHQRSVLQAVKATRDGEATRPTTPAQSVREGRIEEAVSAACMTSQVPERFVSAKSRKDTRQVNRAIRHSQEVKPLNIDYPAGDGKKWIGTGGLVVRTGQSLKSKALGVRLEFGAWLEELVLKGNRLHFRRLRGDGPDFGWGAASLPAVRHPCLQDNMAELMMPPKARAALTQGS
eukprot:s2033_g9.t1